LRPDIISLPCDADSVLEPAIENAR
jgi:hypothetical protein